MQKFNSLIHAICFNAVMAALFTVLSLLSVKIGNNFKITFSALPIVIAAICYGPLSGMAVGLLGAFIEQVMTFGISATTVLWILPAGIRGITVGLLFIFLGRSLSQKCLLPTIIISSVIVTLLNTVITYIDSVIYSYPFSFALATMGIKLLLSIVTAVLISIISVPIIISVSKYMRT